MPVTVARSTRMPFVFLVALACAGLLGCRQDPQAVRFATFNASLNREHEGQLVQDLSTPDNQQAKNVAEVIQRVRPDVLLINEFDFDPNGKAAELFQKNYLSVSQNGADPIRYGWVYVPATNTGVSTGCDLDNDGQVVTAPGTRGYGNDCLGFGQFPGQYGFVILSRYPIDRGGIRTFGPYLWKDVPGAELPGKPDGSPWYDEVELSMLPVSSKNHVDVPIKVAGRTVHVLASHPTPPAFDGPEDRNGKRNRDEIKLIVAELFPSDGTPFIIMGDLNADPNDGGSMPGAIEQLLDHPRVDAMRIPRSDGAEEAARLDGGSNATHKTPSDTDTADFGDGATGPGNLRCDYVLPSRDLKVLGGGVFWPTTADPLHRLVVMKPTVATSDHRLVFLDVQLP